MHVKLQSSWNGKSDDEDDCEDDRRQTIASSRRRTLASRNHQYGDKFGKNKDNIRRETIASLKKNPEDDDSDTVSILT